MAAVVANYALSENVALGAFWARPYNNSDPATKYKNNSMDLFSLLADFNYDQFRVQPYVMYGRVGEDSGWSGVPDGNGTRDRYSNLYMGGLALSLRPTDRLSVNFDGMYGYLKNESENMSLGIEKTQGWLVALGVDYDLSFGVLGGIAWYGSGDDEGDVKDIGRGKGKLGNMPMISQGNSGFYPTRLGYAGSYAMDGDTLISGTGTGTWGAGLHFKDFSFIENLSHTARVFYIQGTNDKDVPLQEAYFSDALYLTTKDKGVELNLDSTPDLGDGLKVIMELGYIYMDWDKDIAYRAKYREDNIWNAQLTFDYRF